ncbi:NAD(P)-binding domain-containing protein [Dongia soli]|uniref:NAD(P)-binding domain-containing protein n=1 Tax=Dongia soli TaxID=600628 RepID=A0ABU5EG53_9PROT|nr:NAD(P)-binding domain-containing protein [Dongia soli]MDY0885188.1 NAD(P)-binding domain-containing protein [Dongia soli]
MAQLRDLPVAVIGAGPIGLAAGANLAERGIEFHIYEAGASVGTNLLDWAHVKIFTTWEQSIDPVSVRFLEKSGWKMSNLSTLPTGGEIVERYLKPLAEVPELKPFIKTDARVTAISRAGIDKVSSKDRAAKPFRLRIADSSGNVYYEHARAVIDASGTWTNANPLGGSGLTVPGETENAAHIVYGMPDILGKLKERYAGRRSAVVGSGYSAINVLLDLARLPGNAKQITWVVRGTDLARIYGGGEADQLAARGALGMHLRQLVDQGEVNLVRGFSTEKVSSSGDGLVLHGETADGLVSVGPVDQIIAATGQRPDLHMTRELRLELDPSLESVKALGPMIDPNLHSCGTVPPHGYLELSHPEPNFFTVGVKSYGRAPTFCYLPVMSKPALSLPRSRVTLRQRSRFILCFRKLAFARQTPWQMKFAVENQRR